MLREKVNRPLDVFVDFTPGQRRRFVERELPSKQRKILHRVEPLLAMGVALLADKSYRANETLRLLAIAFFPAQDERVQHLVRNSRGESPVARHFAGKAPRLIGSSFEQMPNRTM